MADYGGRAPRTGALGYGDEGPGWWRAAAAGRPPRQSDPVGPNPRQCPAASWWQGGPGLGSRRRHTYRIGATERQQRKPAGGHESNQSPTLSLRCPMLWFLPLAGMAVTLVVVMAIAVAAARVKKRHP